jgi:predicted GNAT family acetyltransferase
MTLTVRRFADAEELAEAAMLFLLAHEAEHSLLIGIVGQAIDDPSHWSGTPLFLTVDRGGVPVAVALRTPPYLPILSRVDDGEAIPLLVEQFLREEGIQGVKGPLTASRAFAEEWTRRTNQTAALALSERLYAVERVRPVHGVAGAFRPATAADRPLLIAWTRAFVAEALGAHVTDGHAERSVDLRLRGEQAGFGLWEEGEPVSLAGFAGPTPDGIRIGPVFTPPRFRGHGYASALIAELSRTLLEDGRRFCALYADLANPVSNRIYQRIGYEPVADSAEFRFT